MMNLFLGKRLMAAHEFAARTGVDERVVRKWIAKRQIPSNFDLVDVETLENWISGGADKVPVNILRAVIGYSFDKMSVGQDLDSRPRKTVVIDRIPDTLLSKHEATALKAIFRDSMSYEEQRQAA
jgi:hypothetical protein